MESLACKREKKGEKVHNEMGNVWFLHVMRGNMSEYILR